MSPIECRTSKNVCTNLNLYPTFLLFKKISYFFFIFVAVCMFLGFDGLFCYCCCCCFLLQNQWMTLLSMSA